MNEGRVEECLKGLMDVGGAAGGGGEGGVAVEEMVGGRWRVI